MPASPRARTGVRIAALRAAVARGVFVVLLLASVALLMLGKIDTVVVAGLRMQVTDAVSPILDAFSRPAATLDDAVAGLRDLTRLRDENARLRAENQALTQYERIAHQLQAENLSLRALMNYRPDGSYAFITARVIADNSGAFARSLAISLGSRDGIADGQAVLGGRGLAGRVVETGERSARVLLLTDLNARVPVVVERSRDRAVLGGDNSGRPRLDYLPADADVVVGDRIVTSGDGGVFPPGLPVGVVAERSAAATSVRLLENLDRLEYVRVVDFRRDGGPAALVGVGGPN